MTERRPAGAALAREAYRSSGVLVTARGRAVAGFDAISALHRTTGAVVVPDGATTGREELLLERGVTHDPTFARWLGAPRRLRRDLGVEVRDESGRTILAYRVLGAVVRSATTTPDVDGDSGGTVIAAVRLEHRGWEHVPMRAEPVDPSPG